MGSAWCVMGSKTTHYCDICKSTDGVKSQRLSVVFLTEQNEGRATDPYIDTSPMDICEDCRKRIVTTGQIPFATGAMGFNDYFWKENNS